MPIGADEKLTFLIQFRTDADVVLKKASAAVETFVTKTERSLSRSQRSFKRLQTTLAVTGRAVQRLAGRWLAMAGTFATTFAVFKAVSDAQKFGTAMAEIGTIFTGTSEDLAEVETRILAVSRALGLNETTTAKGFYQIISADITDAAEAMIVLKESSELATVGLADVKITIDVVTSVLKAYGQDVAEAARITDVLFQTVIKGKTTISELAQSLGQVLPIAATLGIRLEEVTAAIATLTQGGIETNTAVIQLRQTFNQLLKPSAQASEILEAYGIHITVASLRTRGFSAVLSDLRDKLGNNAAAYAKIFGNIRALIPILALTGERYEQFNAVLAANDAAIGRVGASLSELLANPFKKFQRFFNSMRQRLREVGSIFITEFAKALDARGGVDAIVERFSTAFKGLDEVAKAVAESFGVIIDHLTVFILKMGGLENASQFFEKIGKLIGQTGKVLVHGFFAGIQVVIGGIIELIRLIDRMSQMFQTAVNAIIKGINSIPFTGEDIELPFPDITIPNQLLADVENAGREMRALFEGINNSHDALKKFNDLRSAGGAHTMSKEDLQFELFLRDNLDKLIPLLETAKERYVALRSELTVAPPSSDIIAGLDEAANALEMFFDTGTDAVDDWLVAFGEASDVLRGIFSAIEEDANAGVDPFARILDPAAAEAAAKETARKYRNALQEEINEISGLVTLLTGISLDPVDVGSKLTPAFDSLKDHIRDLFTDATGIILKVDLDPDSVKKIIQDFAAMNEIVADLSTQIDKTGRAEFDALAATFRSRQQILQIQLAEMDLAPERRRQILDLNELAEQARREATIGFRNFDSFFTTMAGSAEIPWNVTVEGIRRSKSEMEDLVALAFEMGAVTESQLQRIGTAIHENVGEELSKLQRDLMDAQFQSLRGDDAFKVGALDDFQQDLRDTAAHLARVKTQIFEMTVEGTQRFKDLQEAYEEFLKELTGASTAFGAGFLLRMQDIQDEMDDLVARGARLADDISGAVSSGVKTGISEALLGSDSDAAKEAFARGLANAVANAMGDAITGIALKVLGPIGKLIFGSAEDAKDSLSESTAITEITTSALQAIVDVDAATVTAIGTIEATFATAAGTIGNAIGLPAAALEQAAILQMRAAEAMLQAVGAKGLDIPGGGDALGDTAEDAADAGVDSAQIAANAAALEQAAFLALNPAGIALKITAGAITKSGSVLSAAGLALKSAGGLGSAAGKLLFAAGAELKVAADALILAATSGKAEGGYVKGPAIQGFAQGTASIPKRLTEIGAGGIKRQELLTRVREGGQNEAVVPLPGNGRSIPVEFRNPSAMSRMGGTTIVNQEAHLHLNITSDDQSFTRKVAAQMPMIERMLTATLNSGGNNALEGSVRRITRGA